GRSRSTPRRSRLDVSRTTSSEGFAGTSLGRTTVSRSGNQAYDGGGAQRSSPHVHVVVTLAARNTRASASIEPSASPSGATWQARQRRRVLEAGPPAHRTANDPFGTLESDSCVGAHVLVSPDRVEDGRLAEVGSQSRVGDGHHAEPRILDLPFDDLGDDLAHTHAHPAGSRLVAHRILLNCRPAARSIVGAPTS